MRRRRKSWINRRSFTSPADSKELPLPVSFSFDPVLDEAGGRPSSNPEQGMGLTRTSQEKEKVVVKVVVRHPENPELVLFGLRRDDEAWCTPGGHCEPDETPEDGMFREFNEECGLELESVDRVFTYELPNKPTTVHIFEGYGLNADDWEALNAEQDPDSEFACFQYINPLDTDLPLHIPFEHNAVVKYLTQAAHPLTAFVNSLRDLTTEKEAAGGPFKTTPPPWRGGSQAWAFDGVLYDATQNSCHLEWIMRCVNLNPGELQGLEYQFSVDSGVIPLWFYEKYPTAVRINANALSFETLQVGPKLEAAIDEVIAKKLPSPEASIYIDLHAPASHMMLTVNDYLENGLKKNRRRAILRRKHNDKTDTTQWALLSKKAPHHVLKWFGSKKPSDEAVAKEERRIQFFKHKGGVRGDWADEGYEIVYEMNDKNIVITAIKDGVEVGDLEAAESRSQPGSLYPLNVRVLPAHQRKGLATAMYDLAETVMGMKFIPGHYQSPEGKAFRNKRGQAPDLALFKRTDESLGDAYHSENQFEDADLHLGSKPYDSNGMSPADPMREDTADEQIVQYASMDDILKPEERTAQSQVVHSEMFQGVKIEILSSRDNFWVMLNDARPPEGRVAEMFFTKGVALSTAHDMVPSLLRRKKITPYGPVKEGTEVTIKDAVSTENSKGIGVNMDNERESIELLKDRSIRTPIQ